MYRLLYRMVLRRVPAEAAHLAAFGLIRVFGWVARVPGAAWLLGRWLGPRDPVLRVRALGLEFPGPLGLAAGFDKDARGTRGLAALGFGFVEVGTVTARAQPGNPRPRMFRLTADRALVNRMGFNNERAALDGAGGGRLKGSVPLLVKIAPDLADADVDAVADLALELGLDGIIATNTTISRDGLASSPAEVAAAGAGGLSGPPLRDRSLEVLTRLRERAGDRLVLIAAGGIETPDDAWERLEAGATLVQAYTGFVYGGPLWPRRMHAGVARRMRSSLS